MSAQRVYKNNQTTALAAAKLKQENFLAMAAGPAYSRPADLENQNFENLAQSERQPAGQARALGAEESRNDFWTIGFSDFFRQNAQNQNPELKGTVLGGIVGYDYFGSRGVADISAGYTYSHVTEAGNAGSTSSNGATLSLYGTIYAVKGLYFEMGALGGYSQVKTYRNVIFPGFIATATGKFHDWQVVPHAGIGYDVLFKWGVLEPFASFDYAVTFQPAFTETGAAPLNMAIQSETPSLLRSQVGLNVYELIDRESYILVFEQSLSYINQKFWGTDSTSTLAVASASPSSPLTLMGYNKTLNLYSGGADIFYKHKRSGFFLSGRYAGEFGTGYMSNNVQGTLGLFF